MPTRVRWSPAEDYQALRRFLLLAGCAENTAAGRMAAAVESELTPRQRQLVRLYYIQQHTMPDIARELGVSVSTVSRTLRRARARLLRSLRYSGRAILSALTDGD